MKIRQSQGADLFVKSLERLGVNIIFGIPGSHDMYLYNALRKSSIQTVLVTSELHAAFMANGFFRNSGKPGIMIAIAGPGFTNSISGLTEAYFDSAGMICIICKPRSLPGEKFQLQKIDEKEIVRTVTKGNFTIDSPVHIESTLRASFELALTGEPGPVLLEISPGVLADTPDSTQSKESGIPSQLPPVDEPSVEEILDHLRASRRVIFYLGQGAAEASNQAWELIELLQAPVLTTTSGRGIIPESHPQSLPSDLVDDVDLVNSILDSCDLILAVGSKFTHNGSKGFRMKFPAERFIHVDTSQDVLGANYPAQLTVAADAGVFFEALLNKRDKLESREIGWKPGEIENWRQSLIKSKHRKSFPEPHIEGHDPSTAKAFFSSLRDLLPGDTCLITDSGLHQMLARKYYEVSAPRGLIVPADFQSMGFGIPAGIGAKLANPERQVVVITGDGGFALCGMELSTAVREEVNITVILFNDNSMGLIRVHQLNKIGHSHAVKTSEIDYHRFCESLGIQYFKLNDNIHDILKKSLHHEGVSLIEIVLKDTLDMKKASAKGFLRNILKI